MRQLSFSENIEQKATSSSFVLVFFSAFNINNDDNNEI